MKIHKLLFAFILFELISCIKPINRNQNDNYSITSIKKFADIKQQLDSKTLVLLDIDNTIFRANSYYGSTDHFGSMINKEIKGKDTTESQAILNNYYKWIKSQSEIDTKLIDDQIHDFISFAKLNKATIIALTARHPQIAKLTITQVKKHNVKLDQLHGFSFSKFYKNQIYPKLNDTNNLSEKIYDNSEAIFDKGILFAHVLNTKGKIFKDFYYEYKIYALNNNLTMFDKIIFVDDELHNLKSLKQAAKELNIEFHGYHIERLFQFYETQSMLKDSLFQNIIN